MRAVVQRVLYSSVTVGGEKVAEIGEGLNVLLGVSCDDDERDVKYLADKITGLRIFSDDDDKTNLSIFDVKAAGRDCGIIIVSQFTLMGDVRHGKRPAFTAAAEPARAEEPPISCGRRRGKMRSAWDQSRKRRFSRRHDRRDHERRSVHDPS